MERPGEWVELEVARARLAAVIEPLAPTDVPIAESLGRVLAAEVVAPRDVPPFAASAMDGFALRAEDTIGGSARLSIVGASGAGRPATVAVGPGEAVAIATGGALPVGADSVCPIEAATLAGDTVEVHPVIERGAYVRGVGDDTAAGLVVFTAGSVVGPAHVGVMAGLGVESVSVHPAPRVGVLATGDELVVAPEVPGPGQIHDANRPALLAAVRTAHGIPVDLGIVGDDEAALEAALADAATRCDVVLTSGGVSVGTADHAKAVLTRLAPESVEWLEVRIQPGKPFGFAVLEGSGVPVLCLPGNPVSALVSFELLVRPALARRGGRPGRAPRTEVAVAAEAFGPWDDGKLHVVRVVACGDTDEQLRVCSAGGQGSHQLRVTAGANGFALIPHGRAVGVGDPVDVIVTEPDGIGRCDAVEGVR
ncbi:MAG: molybdopterin molybdotransferase MoeA [Actinobacteria bacterium]|nr:molybdopterin molybdotransferase MoeA [Actinomycetota bacterium]